MQLEIDVNTILYSLCMAPKLKLKPKVQKPKIFVDVFCINLRSNFGVKPLGMPVYNF